MIKKLTLSMVIVLFSTLIFANPVSVNLAKNAATNFYKHNASSNTTDYSINDFFDAKYNGMTTYYTFIFNAGGFVMVSADDEVTPIIGYSMENPFDKNNIPPNAQDFFDSYSKEIKSIVEAHEKNLITLNEWNDLLANVFPKSVTGVTAVAPLCATSWNQSAPYSNLVVTNTATGVPTGCVATAMAQVMKKWNYPTTGAGSHSYTHATYGVQTANFGATTYVWASMINSGSGTAAQNTAVATLMYHCGVSIDMNYDPAGSGAYNTAVPSALINYFKYQPSAEAKFKSSFATDALWQTLIQAEMDAGRPVMLAGSSTASGGHEFVCDGYNTAGMKFHINWGWGGTSNGYFSLTALNPSGSNFSSDRQATIRIQPLSAIIPIANFTASTNIPAIGAPTDFTDQSLNAPTSWLWTFEGGTPATSTAQNPTGITFATNGYHVVSLKATNANGSDIKTKERYVKVGGAATVWTKQNSSFTFGSRGVDEIDIINANTVWAKAYDGSNPTGYIREITRTNDGGATWTPGAITFTNSTNYGVSNLYAVDYTTAYACMFPITGTGGAIVKTIDGGTTWNIQTTAPFTNSWADFVHFFDANNGVCMGDPIATTAGSDFVIYTTTNGGTTWTQVPLGSIPNTLANEAGITNEYFALGNTIWFTSSKGRSFKSTDKGLTWTVASIGFTGAYNSSSKLTMKSALVGIAVLDTVPYTMRKTNDGGATWTTLVPTGYLVKHPELAFVPGTSSTWFDVSVSPSNGSSYSIDDCSTFLNVDTGSVQFTAVSFFDINTGWAGSFNTSSTDGGIYKWNPAIFTGVTSAISKEDNIKVYPIPAKNIVNLSLGTMDDENMTITIYNMLGAKVMNQKMKAISGDIVQLDLSTIDSGVYFINIINGGKSITKKITIAK